MAVTTNLPIPFLTGFRLIDCDQLNAQLRSPTWSSQDGLTATAGGAQASVALSTHISRFTTVASGSDSAQLPKATPGRIRVVVNAAAANAMAVFPQTGESINALSANTAISVAANKTIIFFCASTGVWNSVLTA